MTYVIDLISFYLFGVSVLYIILPGMYSTCTYMDSTDLYVRAIRFSHSESSRD